MNKSELVDSVAELSGLTKADALRALDAVIESVSTALSVGDSVNLTGFGSFSVKDAPERTGRNPSTGKEILIAAAKKPQFKPGKQLKLTTNGAA